ncbi:hypothetical protein MRX96_057548 [Rhipicephalus microplus]
MKSRICFAFPDLSDEILSTQLKGTEATEEAVLAVLVERVERKWFGKRRREAVTRSALRTGSLTVQTRSKLLQAHTTTCTYSEPSRSRSISPGWDSQLCWYERIMLLVLRQGTIPQHFAIVADRNRRFPRKKKMSLSQVYSLMFRKFTTTWPYMAALGVPEVTYFMISTRNFSRNTRDRVTAIDEMMKFFARTLQCLNIFRKIRLKVTAVGNLDLLPIEMREKIVQTEIGSDDESPAAKLRLCVAYNTKVGLKNIVLDLVKAVQAGAIQSEKLNILDVRDEVYFKPRKTVVVDQVEWFFPLTARLHSANIVKVIPL